MAEYSIIKNSLNFEFQRPQFGNFKISQIFGFNLVKETIFLNSLTMPLFFYTPVFARLRYEESSSTVDLMLTIHQSEEEALNNLNVIGFSFDSISKNPLLFPYTKDLILLDGPISPEVEGSKYNFTISEIAGFNKYAIFKCEPGF